MPSTTESAANADTISDPNQLQAAVSVPGKQLNTEKEASKPRDPQLEHETPPPSRPAEIKAPAQRPDESSNTTNVMANSAKNRLKSRRDEQTDEDADEGPTQARATKRTKHIKAEPRVETESIHDNSTFNLVTTDTTEESKNQAIPPRPFIDSYRPSYPSNQPLYSGPSSGSVSRPKSRATTPVTPNVPRGPRRSEVYVRRGQEVSGSQTPHCGGIPQAPGSQNPYHNGRQSFNRNWSQSSPQNVSRASEPPHSHESRFDSATGARTVSQTQANHGNQGFGGRTPGHTLNQTWGNATPHSGHQQEHNQAFRGRNNRKRAFSHRGATGGVHHHFGDDDNENLLAS